MRIAILGAGFAGLSVAWHLQKLIPCAITLFDKKGIGGGASGIATGLLHPYAGEQGRRSLHATEALAAAQLMIPEDVIVQRGIYRYVQNEEQKAMFLSHAEKYGDVRQDGDNRFFITSGMTIDCPRYLGYLASSHTLIIGEVPSLDALKDFDAIVVAAGAGTKDLLSGLPISTLKGQVLKCRGKPPEASSICKGYIALTSEPDTCFVGSTYERGDMTESPNLQFAQQELFPKVGFFYPEVENLEVLEARAAFRVTRVGHYLPIAERIDDRTWVLTALGSRGLLYHACFGEKIAQEISSY